MISFIATDTDFEKWGGASIDPKPLELYDINGQKLYYQLSVYKDNNIIGRIDIGATKKLGSSIQVIEFDPRPFDADEAIKKSIEIAKKEYPDGKIKSTKMVVYSYPSIGAMTVVKDKTTGEEGGLGKTGSFDDGTPIFSQLTSEINNNRPVVSMIPGHVRVCRGYSDSGVGLHYLKINDPLPVGSGHQFLETWGAETCHIYM